MIKLKLKLTNILLFSLLCGVLFNVNLLAKPTIVYKNNELTNAAKVVDKADNFTLEDQFGNKIGINFPSDKVVVLVFGDRKGSDQVEGWVRPLYNKFTDKIYIFGIAELSVVPWAVRPMVRGIIKSKSKTPVMLDWTGKVAKSFGCEKGKANLFVVNRDGTISSIKRGAASSAGLNSLYQDINSIL